MQTTTSRFRTPRSHFLAFALAFSASCAGAAFADDVGTLVDFQPNTPARASEVNQNFSDVRSAVNSKQDESSAAGVEFVRDNGPIPLVENVSTTVATITVTIPSSGFVVVHFNTFSLVLHTTGNDNGPTCFIARNGLEVSGQTYQVIAAEPSGARANSLHVMWVQPETTPGSVTYSVGCHKDGPDATFVNNYTLLATYFEHRY